MKALFILAVLAAPLFADRVDEYLKFLDEQKNNIRTFGDYKAGEIEIVRDREKIKEIESMQMQRLKKKGLSDADAESAAQVGIIAKDMYWIFVRDAVIFPTGAYGTYNRMVWVSSLDDGIPGVVVMPILPDGKIVLNLNFRHATRSWELELPRGFKNKNETMEEAAVRELEEETGMQIDHYHFLGAVSPDSGALSAIAPVFAGTVTKKGLSNQEDSEAILRLEAFTPATIKEALAKGWIEMDVKGKKEKVFVRDGYLTYALLLAEQQKLI